MKRAVVVVIAMLAAACSSSPNAPSPFTDQVSNTVQAGTPSLGVVGFIRHDFNAPRAGSLSITLTWNNPAVDLDLWLSDANCSDVTTMVAGGCRVLGRSDSTVGASERVAATVAQGQTMRVWVLNYSPAGQGYTLAFDIR
jgi:hypothetical protein